MTLIYFLISILFLILIHEWGHFAAARFFGIGVEKFSIGFGKALFTYTDIKTGTRWQLGPIPLGGFVGLLGENTQDAASTPAQPVQGKPFMQAPLHAKVVILLAGVTVNLLFAALAYGCLAYWAANPALPIVSNPPLSSPAHQAHIQSGDQILSVNGQAIASWRDLQVALLGVGDFNESSNPTALQLSVLRSKQTIELAITPQAIRSAPIKTSTPIEEALGFRLRTQGLVVNGFAPGSAAERAGLQLEDVITHINGETIDHPSVLIERVKNFQQTNISLELQFERADKPMQLSIKPSLDAQGAYKLGIQFAARPQLSAQEVSLPAAALEGLSTTYLASVLTVKALGKFLLNPLKTEELAGPVTIAKTAKASADRGWQAALAFLAGLSVSVGVLNLLPVPVLDGGQVLYHLGRSAIKRLRSMLGVGDGQQVSEPRAQLFDKLWLSIGVSFVVLLTLAAFYTDFQRILSAQ